MDLSSSVAVFVFTTIVLLGVSSAADNSVNTCRTDQYYNRKLMDCVPCSLCGGDNPVFLRACNNDKDTLCGQVAKFQFRQSVFADVNNAADESEIDVTVDVIEGDKQTATTLLVAKDETGGLWFVVTMVLIAILVLLSLAVVILLFVWCFVCKRKQREMVIDPVFTNSLLRHDGQGTVRKMEQFKLITET